MSKVRVYELARELGIENKELIARLEKLGILSKKPTSTLEDTEVERAKRDFRGVDNFYFYQQTGANQPIDGGL